MPTVFDSVYVDVATSGSDKGTASNPFNTLDEVARFVADDGEVFIEPGTYPENVLIARPMTLKRNGASGSVVIGN